MFAMNPEEDKDYESPRDKACAMLMGLIVMATGRMVSPDAIASVVDSIVQTAEYRMMATEPKGAKDGKRSQPNTRRSIGREHSRVY